MGLSRGSTPSKLGAVFAELNSPGVGNIAPVDFDTFYDENIDEISGGGLVAALAAIGLTYTAGVFEATERGLWAVHLEFTPEDATGYLNTVKLVPDGVISYAGWVKTEWGTTETHGPGSAFPSEFEEHLQQTFMLGQGGSFQVQVFSGDGGNAAISYADMDIYRIV